MGNDCIPEYEATEFAGKGHKYCLLIPLFNEGARFSSQLEKMRAAGVFEAVDVAICDAGSTDGCTGHDLLTRYGVNALLVRRGRGRYSTDLRMGYAWALARGYEGFITVDGNDKDDTAATPDFVARLDEGYDYVQGSRYIPGGKGINTPLIRQLALKLINEPVMSLCAKQHLTDTTNGFRAYSRKFLTDPRVQPFREAFFGYELIYYLPVRACRLGFRVVETPVTRAYPDSGEVPSKIGGFKGNLYQLSILWHMIRGDYNPDKKKS